MLAIGTQLPYMLITYWNLYKSKFFLIFLTPTINNNVNYNNKYVCMYMYIIIESRYTCLTSQSLLIFFFFH